MNRIEPICVLTITILEIDLSLTFTLALRQIYVWIIERDSRISTGVRSTGSLHHLILPWVIRNRLFLGWIWVYPSFVIVLGLLFAWLPGVLKKLRICAGHLWPGSTGFFIVGKG